MVLVIPMRPHRWVALLALLLCAGRSEGAAPVLEYLFPAGGSPGMDVMLTLGGKQSNWPVELWSDSSHLSLQAEEKAGQVRVTVSPDAPPGPCWIRAFNNEGASEPALFLVGSLPSMPESEPNHAPEQAQAVTAIPMTVDGRLEKSEDVDTFRVRLSAGQVLVARLYAYRLDAPMDAFLQVTDSANTVLAVEHDGDLLDPVLVWKAAHEGEYLVKVSAFAYPPQANVRFTSGENTVYRLDLHAGPYVVGAWPPGLDPGRVTRVEAVGWNFDKTPLTVDVDPAQTPQGGNGVMVSGFENAFRLPMNPHPGTVELEPNDTAAEATPAPVPATLAGRMDRARDVDRYAFEAVKDRAYSMRARAASLGYPGDLVLTVEDGEGKELARNDDGAARNDPDLAWKAPADGTFQVVMRDLFDRGGEDHFYLVDLAEEVPGVQAQAKANAVLLKAGGSAELKVDVKRTGGFKEKVQLRMAGLPEGVTAEPVLVSEKGGETSLTLKAADAVPVGRALVQVEMFGGAEGEKALGQAEVPVKGRHAEAGDLLRNTLPGIWLIVTSK